MQNSLLALFDPAVGVSTDTRTLQPQQLFFALRGPSFDGNTYAAAALAAGAGRVIVDDKSVLVEEDERYILVPDALTALQDLARSYRRTWTIPVIALTGSNGKTTTKELLTLALSTTYEVAATTGNLNNHIGVPLTLLSVQHDAEVVVIELGANHQGEIAELCRIAEPTHGFITNIGRAHLEGFGGTEGVKRGKGELFDYLSYRGGVSFVDACDSVVWEVSQRVDSRIVHTTSADCMDRVAMKQDQPVRIEANLLSEWPSARFELRVGQQSSSVQLQLPGAHNYRNACLAAAVASYFKVTTPKLVQALSSYTPDNARSEVREWGGAAVLFDVYNANPDSVAVALDWLASRTEGTKVAVLGEMAELGAFAKTAHEQVLAKAAKIPQLQLALLGQVYEDLDGPHRCFQSPQEVAHWLTNTIIADDTAILIKGSRSNRLERVLGISEV